MARAEDIVRWFHGLLRSLLIRATSAFAGGASVSSSKRTDAQLTTAASVTEHVAQPSPAPILLIHSGLGSANVWKAQVAPLGTLVRHALIWSSTGEHHCRGSGALGHEAEGTPLAVQTGDAAAPAGADQRQSHAR